jgi:hypothetical protein
MDSLKALLAAKSNTHHVGSPQEPHKGACAVWCWRGAALAAAGDPARERPPCSVLPNTLPRADKLLQTKLREKEIKEALKQQRAGEKSQKEEVRVLTQLSSSPRCSLPSPECRGINTSSTGAPGSRGGSTL